MVSGNAGDRQVLFHRSVDMVQVEMRIAETVHELARQRPVTCAAIR